MTTGRSLREIDFLDAQVYVHNFLLRHTKPGTWQMVLVVFLSLEVRLVLRSTSCGTAEELSTSQLEQQQRLLDGYFQPAVLSEMH